jgi:hypothetical protein
MRLKIQSANKQSIRQVAKLAGRMADQVDRLRYLRGMVTVGPGMPWLHAMAVWIVAAAVCAVAVALVLWSKS